MHFWLLSSYRLKYEGKKASCFLPRTSFVLFDAHMQSDYFAKDFPNRIVIPVSYFTSSEMHVQCIFLFLLRYYVSRMKHEVSPFGLLPGTLFRPSKYECLPVSMLEFNVTSKSFLCTIYPL
jgi:hypothetical protein